MIITGVRTTESTVATGQFSCPCCRTRQNYRQIVYQRWFTLYFIPVMPLGRLGEQVECQGCYSRFAPEAADGDDAGGALAAILIDDAASPTGGWQSKGAGPKGTGLKGAGTTPNSRLAVASLVLGLVSPAFLCACGMSLFTSAAAIVTGHLALRSIRRAPQPLAGHGMAMAGLSLGYLMLAASMGVWAVISPAFVEGYREGGAEVAESAPGEGAAAPIAAEVRGRLRSAEMKILTASGESPSGNTDAARQLADRYSQALQVMRESLFTADRERLFSLTQGEFLVHCEQRPGRCAFLVHVPAYRDFTPEAKELLEVGAWRLAQHLVEEAAAAEDALAVGLRGTALYGAVLVGTAAIDEANPENFTRGERDDLLAFFAADGDDQTDGDENTDTAPTESSTPATPAPPLAVEEPVVEEPAAPEAAPAEASATKQAASPPVLATNVVPPPVAPRWEPPRPRVAPQPPPEDLGPVAAVVRRFPDMGWNVESLAFAPDGRFLAAGKLDCTLAVFDVEAERRVQEEPRMDEMGQIVSLAFSHDGRTLLAGGYRGVIRRWSVSDTGHLTAADPLHGHDKPVTTLIASPTAPRVLSGDADGKLLWQAWDDPAAEPRTVAAFERGVLAAHLGPAEDEALATDGQRLLQIDLKSGHIVRTHELGRQYAHAAAFSRDGSLAAVSLGNTIRISDTRTGAEVKTLAAGNELQWSVAFLPGGARLITGGRGKAVLWSLIHDKPLGRFDLGGVLYIKLLALTSDGARLASIPSSAGQTITIAEVP